MQSVDMESANPLFGLKAPVVPMDPVGEVEDEYPVDTQMQNDLISDAAGEEVDKVAAEAEQAKYGPPEAPQIPVKLYGYAEIALKHSVPNKVPPLTLGGRANYALSYTSSEPAPSRP